MEKYLDKLNEKLYFLDEEERQKVLDRYKNLVNGKTYKDIVQEIGSVDVVVKKICCEYNLNYQYYIRRNRFDADVLNLTKIIANFIRDIMRIIKKYTYTHTLESFLEVCIKLITLIILFALLKLPCILLESFGNYVNKLFFYPYNTSFDTILNLIISFIYLIGCVILIVKVFGTYKREEKVLKEEPKQSDKEYNWLEFIIRIIIYLIILIPLCILGLSILLGLIISIYLVISGIKIFGIIILLMGLLGLIYTLFQTIKDSLNNKNRSFLPMIITSTIIFILGIGFTIYNFSKFKYPNSLEKSSLVMITEEKKITLDDTNTNIILSKGNYEVITDDNLTDNEIRVEVSYYDDYVDVLYHQEKVEDINYLVFRTTKDDKVDFSSKINNIIKDLKKGYIFNYSNVDKINIKIYANNEVKNNIEK